MKLFTMFGLVIIFITSHCGNSKSFPRCYWNNMHFGLFESITRLLIVWRDLRCSCLVAAARDKLPGTPENRHPRAEPDLLVLRLGAPLPQPAGPTGPRHPPQPAGPEEGQRPPLRPLQPPPQGPPAGKGATRRPTWRRRW